jgi:acyl carrier protein
MLPSSSEHIRSEVNRIFIELFELKAEDLKPESHLFNDLGLDSLDAIDMAVRFQREFKVKPSHEDIKKIQTMGDIYKLVERYGSDLKSS